MLFRNLLVGLAACCALGATAALAQESETKLMAADGKDGDQFGWSVSISGDHILVGAFSDDELADDAGAAYVYRYDGADWTEEAKLTASSGAAGDRFGVSAFISGDRLIVGAAYEDLSDQKEDAGAAYVFRFDGAAWVEEARLTASDSEEDDQFGWTVAVHDSVAVVGSTWDNNYTGGVYVYRYDGSSWSQEVKLTAGDGFEGQRFGGRVHLAENRLIVGARFDQDLGAGAGAAYVFRYDGTAWIEEEKLTAGDGAPRDGFGSAVALDKDVAIVGASNSTSGIGIGTGAAYVFRYDGTTWNEEAKLLADDAAPAMDFGNSVAIDGGRVLIGALNEDEVATNAGAAYVFRNEGMNWTQEAKLKASDGSVGDTFGTGVAMKNGIVVVGAPSVDRDPDTGVGAIYLYELPPFNPVSTEASSVNGGSVLHAAYPNPFSGRTILTVELAEVAHVRLEVYDVVGRRVANLSEATHQPGTAHIVWDGRNGSGSRVPSGTYLLRLVVDGLTERYVETGKVVLSR